MAKNPKITIIDYGICNLYSIAKAFRGFTEDCVVTEDPSVVEASDAIILPGVGAFKAGMEGLKIRGLIKSVKEFASSGRPILGICLGAQLLLSQGREFETYNGLDIIKGEVIPFSDLGNIKAGVKIPHIGWNEIRKPAGISWDDTILDTTVEGSHMYFVHSYVLQPRYKEDIFALTEYEGIEFCSAIRKDNIYGCQFHPEKSGELGLKIIRDFIKII